MREVNRNFLHGAIVTKNGRRSPPPPRELAVAKKLRSYRFMPTSQATPCPPPPGRCSLPAAPAHPATHCARWPRFPSGLRRWCGLEPPPLKKVALGHQAVLEAKFPSHGSAVKSAGRRIRVPVALRPSDLPPINVLETVPVP